MSHIDKLLLKVVVEATKSKEFRFFVKEQAKQQFDGDYDIPLASSLAKEVSKGQSLEEFLLATAQKNLKNEGFNKEVKYFFKQLIKQCPFIYTA
jgi:cation transport regulator ChaC